MCDWVHVVASGECMHLIFFYLAVAAELRPLGKSMLAVQNKETAIRILRSLNQSKCIASHIRSMYRG